MSNSINSINSLIPVIEKKPEKSNVENNPVGNETKETLVEKPDTNEGFSTSKVATIVEKDNTIIPTTTNTPPTPVVIDKRKSKDPLHKVSSVADEDTKKYDEEEREFIEDVEAAHGYK